MPTFNERGNIEPLLSSIVEFVPQAHLLVVDDASPDGTADVVRAMEQRLPRLELLQRRAKTGLGSAYVEAFRRLLTDADVGRVVTMDADFSHPPRLLPALIAASEGCDVVVGSRYVAGGTIVGWERWRRMLSSFGNRYARLVTGVPIHDLTAGFVCFRREALERIDLARIDSAGYAYTIESKCLAYWAGARVREIPIAFEERRRGESKIGSSVILEGVLAPLRVRMRRSAAQR